MTRVWVCGKCGYKSIHKSDIRRHLKRMFPCDMTEFIVDADTIDALDEDVLNYNIFTLPIITAPPTPTPPPPFPSTPPDN